jgi:hypothetical protein
MAFPLLPATLLLITAGLAALDYFLPPEPLPSAPDTEPITPPYTPPFTGGQCVGRPYRLEVGWTDNRGAVYAVFGNDNSPGGTSPVDVPTLLAQGTVVNGKINSITSFNRIGTSTAYRMTINGAFVNFLPNGTPSNPVIRRVFPIGFTDNCGNIPNPNPGFPIAGSGLAQSPDPDLDELAEPLTLGLVPTNLAALLAAALAALQAAETIADLANALVDAIDAIGKLIDKLNPKKKDDNKSIFKFDFGQIQKDGYLKFYGTNNNPNFEAVYLDILFTSEPIGIGRYFGEKSPNRYIYNRLGYIAFVSPSLGVMEVRELEFYRCSLPVPKDCVGFFYHLGLNGTIKANATAIYELEEEPIEEE